MDKARWDVPQTEEGLQTLLTRLAESQAAGDEAAVGRGLLALAFQVKWVRSDNHEPPFVRAATLTEEALAIFRRIDDPKGLLQALRSTSMFIPPDETDRRFTEALNIAKSLDDENEVARTMAAHGRALGLRDKTKSAQLNSQALAIFLRNDLKYDAAICLQSLATNGNDSREKFERALRAAQLFRDVGELKNATRATVIGIMQGQEFMTWPELEGVVRQGLGDAQKIEDRTSERVYYGHLAKVAAAKGDADEAAKYLRWQKDLEESDGLTPKERRRENIEMTKMLIDLAKTSGDQESIALFKEELKRLEKLHVK